MLASVIGGTVLAIGGYVCASKKVGELTTTTYVNGV
jgi:hypothetical protein